LVNKVEITGNRIITRDNAGNTTFDTNNLYLKTDAGGSMYIGGWSRQPVYYGVASTTATEQVLPDRIYKGYPLSIIDYSSTAQNLRWWPTSTTTTPWYDMYVPDGISSFYGVGGDNRSAPVMGLIGLRIPPSTPIFSVSHKSNLTDSWNSVGFLGASGAAVVSFLNNGQQQFPQLTTRWFYPNPDEMLSTYQTNGAGYYRVKFLVNWGTPYVENYDANSGTWSTRAILGANENTTLDVFLGSTLYSNSATYTYPLVLPSIKQDPTNIDVAVTP
jgi:hypothetical protein